MHDTVRTANLLGALALTVTDLMLAGTSKAAGVSASGAAALVVLADSPGLSVTDLGRRVGLSQPAAARMVDSLEARDLAVRLEGAGRSVSVTPTSAGLQASNKILAARTMPLAALVGTLDDDDQDALARVAAALLPRLYDQVGNADLVCRLCDRAACTARATCPVGQAERDRCR